MSQVALKAFFRSLDKDVENDSTGYFNGMKITIMEPTIFKTQMLSIDSVVNGLKKTWNSTDKNVREEYTTSFFNGIIAFVRIWQFFEVFDFLTLNGDISLVSDAISHSLTSKSPEKNYRVIGLIGRVGFPFIISFLPQEIIEYFYQVAIYFMVIFGWELSTAKKLFQVTRKPSTQRNIVQ